VPVRSRAVVLDKPFGLGGNKQALGDKPGPQ